MTRYIYSIVLAGALLAAAGCSDDGGPAWGWVVNIEAVDSSIFVGEGTVLRIDFDFDYDAVVYDDRNVELVIRLPAELRYREGTAEIEEESGDDPIGAQEFLCSSGESYLLFDMDKYDLEEAEYHSFADARLKLTVDAVAPNTFAVVEAEAGGDVLFDCGEEVFLPEASTRIRIN